MAGTFTYRKTVRFGDVDHAGIVFYPRFFEYFHVAFEELFAQAGGRHYREVLDAEGVGFPAVHIEADFRRPLAFGDAARIEVTLDRVGERSATFHYRVYPDPPAAMDTAGTLGAEARITCACMDMKTRRAVPIPPRLRAFLEQHLR